MKPDFMLGTQPCLALHVMYGLQDWLVQLPDIPMV